MNFTREPTIETIITPKEGNKLLIRNSKREIRDDYLVDAIEVVTFGHSIFYRSLERPKSFIVPVSDYEVVEVKETRLVLKSATVERSIKIGGGKISSRPESSVPQDNGAPEEKTDTCLEKKRERRRPRRRRTSDDRIEGGGASSEGGKEAAEKKPEEKKGGEEKKRVSRLLPPPPTLIAQTIGKYREAIHPEAKPLPSIDGTEEEKNEDPKKKIVRKRAKAEPKSIEEAETPDENEDAAAPPEKEEKKSEEPKPEGPKPEGPKPEGKEGDDKSSFWGFFS